MAITWSSTPVVHKVTIPNAGGGTSTYYLKDYDVREWAEEIDTIVHNLESSVRFIGVTTTAITDGSTTNPVTIAGESVTAENGDMVSYNPSSGYAREFIWNGNIATPCWQEFGSTGSLKAFAFADTGTVSVPVNGHVPQMTVNFTGGTTDKVLGEDTTFALSSGTVSSTGGTTVSVMNSTMTATVPKPSYTTRYMTATPETDSALTGLGSPSTAAFVKSYPGSTKKLATTSVPNVTSVGTAPAWAASVSNETLAFTWSAGSVPTLGTAITAATGKVASSDSSGDSVLVGLGTPTTDNGVTGYPNVESDTFVKSVALTENSSTTTGALQYIKSASTSGTNAVTFATGTASKLSTVYTTLPTYSVGTGITVGTNDRVTAVTGIGTGKTPQTDITGTAQTLTVNPST